MMFEYILPYPNPSTAALEPKDTPPLTELVTHARKRAPSDASSLACPTLPSSVELPRFAGISLADSMFPEPVPTLVPEPPLVASLTSQTHTLLGPGAMTMTLAALATLVFGVAAITL